MKSEVKKKMTLDEHAAHTPKSPKRAQVENSCAENLLTSSSGKNSRAKFNEIVFTTISDQYLVQRKAAA
jgi:hypothetical protein